jgi:hypothetical protein
MKKCIVCDNDFDLKKRTTCSKICSGRSRNPDFLITKRKIDLLPIDAEALSKENYSLGMIYDLAKRDYGLEGVSPDQFKYYLNTKFRFDLEAYNKKPQWWKLQFKYPKSWSVEEIKQDIIKKCLVGQSKTVEARNKKGNTGNTKFKREDSPLCFEFYTSRGFSEKIAKEKILEINIAGAMGALKVHHTGLENKVAQMLDDQKKKYEKEFRVKLLPEEKIYNKSCYIYDFFLPEENCLIECHGQYWHASPEIYKSGDKIKLPRHGEVLVDYIWGIDKHKEDTAKKRGFNYKVIWENE